MTCTEADLRAGHGTGFGAEAPDTELLDLMSLMLMLLLLLSI